jgi:acetyl-CoA carboxylase biotin carboxyl carrier protein
MDLRKLKKLIDLVQESGIAELEITEGEEKVRINRVGSPGHPGMMTIPQALAPMAAAPGTAVITAPAAGEAPAEPEGHIVKSPMVGTFYRSSAPGSKPFVEIGQNVNAGETLCIIEAMKLMNEIDSEYDGEIANIYVENGQPVQYGERLFAIRTR